MPKELVVDTFPAVSTANMQTLFIHKAGKVKSLLPIPLWIFGFFFELGVCKMRPCQDKRNVEQHLVGRLNNKSGVFEIIVLHGRTIFSQRSSFLQNVTLPDAAKRHMSRTPTPLG